MLSNEQVVKLCKDYLKNIQNYINIIEIELKKENPDLKSISSTVGKMSSAYSFVSEMTGLFSDIDYRTGGIKKAVWSPNDQQK